MMTLNGTKDLVRTWLFGNENWYWLMWNESICVYARVKNVWMPNVPRMAGAKKSASGERECIHIVSMYIYVYAYIATQI